MTNNTKWYLVFTKVATGKWVIIGILIAGLIRISWAAMRGADLTDAVGITVIGLVLASIFHLLFHRAFRDKE